MKKLGEGLQYAVFDLENGRVLKKFHSWLKAVRIMYHRFDGPLLGIPGHIRLMEESARKSFEILERHDIPPEVLGNPSRLRRFDYEQDKATPLHQFFQSDDREEGNKIVDRFVQFNCNLLFNYGIIDISFKLSNFGMTDSGDIILTDIGEIVDDAHEIEFHRKRKDWHSYYVERDIKNKETRAYFRQEMDKHFGL